jgi:hypothetical protein
VSTVGGDGVLDGRGQGASVAVLKRLDVERDLDVVLVGRVEEGRDERVPRLSLAVCLARWVPRDDSDA